MRGLCITIVQRLQLIREVSPTTYERLVLRGTSARASLD